MPDRFKVGLKLAAVRQDDSRRELRIEELWTHKGSLILKLTGVDSIADAEALIGCELQVPREQRPQLESGWTYISDLVACTVLVAGRELGKVTDVKFGAGEAPLLVVGSGRKEYEIPYAQAYLEDVNIEKRQIKMALPEGMLELDAPLSAEEKKQQQKSGQ